MRIDAYNQISAIYNTKKAVKTRKTSAAAPTDQLQISQFGRDYQIAKQAVAQSPDVREDKVSDIRANIQSGSYEVSSDDFASKLLAKFNEKGM